MPWILLALCLLMNGCAGGPRIPLFQGGEGAYLALSPGSVTPGQAQVLADQYGAVVRQGRRRKIAGDIEEMMGDDRARALIITPANRDFVSEVLAQIPVPSGAPVLMVQIYGESTPELEKEMTRLGLKRSVQGRPGDDE